MNNPMNPNSENYKIIPQNLFKKLKTKKNDFFLIIITIHAKVIIVAGAFI
jgi:hypothetical protein